MILVFDTETTGFPAEDFSPEIVQIAAVLHDPKTHTDFATLNLIVTPNSYIPDHVAAIHGITTEIAREQGVTQQEAKKQFISLLRRCDTVVAHNLAFDMQMLELNWPEAWAIAADKIQYDTMNESRLIVNLPEGKYHGTYTEGPKPPRLNEAYEFFTGQPLENAHDAMADTYACLRVYHGIEAAKVK